MLKKYIATLMLAILGFTGSAYAGMTNSGTFELVNSTAWCDLMNKDPGFIVGEGATFLEVLNYGTVTLNKCTMKGPFTSFGTLTAAHTIFKKNVTITHGTTTLDSCILENLIIKDDLEGTAPVIILTGTTTINGIVTFITGQGQVYKGSHVEILGEVIHGTIQDLKE